MSKFCKITGKKPLTGYHVSHSHKRVKRRQYPNMQKKKLMNPATGKMETVYISTRGLRTLEKWQREGRQYDLRELA